ncbi:hypothetical protein G7Y89_g6704 [Cudoniella acicularis]|uniref:Uncharacterized protein n=1 Tax=Cudoniella acicularis TaxID=354080 RepID=A0A8H4W2L3_9HELO|nr:hypothetical protein G7Y89_g6704 [Cudoniella acicularis]
MYFPNINEEDSLRITVNISSQSPPNMGQDRMALSNLLNPVVDEQQNSETDPSQQERKMSDISMLLNNIKMSESYEQHLPPVALSLRMASTSRGRRRRSSPMAQSCPPRLSHERKEHRNSLQRSSTPRSEVFMCPEPWVQSPEKARVRKRPIPTHSNRPYSPEAVDFIRYMKEDCGHKWDDVPELYYRQFVEHAPTKFNDRTTAQAFSSRYYRDDKAPMLDKNWNFIRLEDGRIKYRLAKVRERHTPEGKKEDIPYTLIDKHPDRAVTYSWVSEEHKAEAERILRGERSGTRKDIWRIIIFRACQDDEQRKRHRN